MKLHVVIKKISSQKSGKGMSRRELLKRDGQSYFKRKFEDWSLKKKLHTVNMYGVLMNWAILGWLKASIVHKGVILGVNFFFFLHF